MNFARVCSVLLPFVILSCSDLAAPRSGSSVRLTFNVSTSAQSNASAVAIKVNYRRIGGEVRPLFSTRVSIETGTRTLSIALDIAECLNDAGHVGAPGECTVDLELTLLNAGGALLDRKEIGPVVLRLDSEATAPPVTLSTTAAATLFEDDFEGPQCLGKWTVGGRRVAGTNVADCVVRRGSNVGHLYKTSFTEISMSPAIGPFLVSDQPTVFFDMEVSVFSAPPPGPTYYASAGALFIFFDAQGNQLGFVDVIAATTPYRFNEAARDPAWGYAAVSANTMQTHAVPMAQLLAL
ncbi:MAG: hypothetical protein ACREMA_08360, partial [Longimicrobiales bacterium]